jgi:hypothetical protein
MIVSVGIIQLCGGPAGYAIKSAAQLKRPRDDAQNPAEKPPNQFCIRPNPCYLLPTQQVSGMVPDEKGRR